MFPWKLLKKNFTFFSLMESLDSPWSTKCCYAASMTRNDDVRSVSNLKLPNTPEPGAASSIWFGSNEGQGRLPSVHHPSLPLHKHYLHLKQQIRCYTDGFHFPQVGINIWYIEEKMLFKGKFQNWNSLT